MMLEVSYVTTHFEMSDPVFDASAIASSEPQSDINDLVHDVDLSKPKTKLLAFRLKGWNLL